MNIDVRFKHRNHVCAYCQLTTSSLKCFQSKSLTCSVSIGSLLTVILHEHPLSVGVEVRECGISHAYYIGNSWQARFLKNSKSHCGK